MRPLVRAVLRGALRDIRHVKAVPPGRASGVVARVYAQARRDFGVLAPPLALHSPAPTALAASWLLLRETLLVDVAATRAEKETVATAVSRANACPYCVEVHRSKAAVLPAQAPEAVAALSAWAGGTAPRAPFPAARTPELAGVAVTFHYLNRMVSVFLADSPVPDAAPGFLREPLMRTVARGMRADDPGRLPPGLSLDLLPPAPPAPGLDWADGRPEVARALARAVAAVDQAARWVPGPVREDLRDRLAAWDGRPPGLSGAWLDPAPGRGTPDPAAAATARLALLTAFAPYRVTDADIAAFRRHHPSDRALVELTSWAALTTAVHQGTRLTVPAPA
ncbi:carboxymuconolactone decarboxylase family protein [Streptomyces sp. RerS4]|uniref:carboxymuconolactone decarboxylase family protein n=1 Tax=Streptomyces sp. RerS4 TaxID=2942449 RepID=UPI00201C3549|nr:carboxymuconolactone decarboxylase family protein [Streptomyces sp. RerS4]UQX05399.1 carboxymuconolactone decarboxylase family protein [Streptomyces sp. RerS4]